MGRHWMACEGSPELLFTDNDTNTERLYGVPKGTHYAKDGIHNCIVAGDRRAVNAEGVGTKAAAHYVISLGPGETETVRLLHSDSRGELFGETFHNIGVFDRSATRM